MPVVNKQVVLAQDNVVLSSIVVKDSAGAITYVADTDYSVAYNNDGQPVISILPSPGTIPPAATTLEGWLHENGPKRHR